MPIILEVDEETNIEWHKRNIEAAKFNLTETMKLHERELREALDNLYDAYDWAKSEGVYV